MPLESLFEIASALYPAGSLAALASISIISFLGSCVPAFLSKSLSAAIPKSDKPVRAASHI
jgi:hypothetical protein